jgi:hypothetical protein
MFWFGRNRLTGLGFTAFPLGYALKKIIELKRNHCGNIIPIYSKEEAKKGVVKYV